jgi:hypothetical protein
VGPVSYARVSSPRHCIRGTHGAVVLVVSSRLSMAIFAQMHARKEEEGTALRQRKGVVRLHGAEPRKAMQERCGVAPGGEAGASGCDMDLPRRGIASTRRYDYSHGFGSMLVMVFLYLLYSKECAQSMRRLGR